MGNKRNQKNMKKKPNPLPFLGKEALGHALKNALPSERRGDTGKVKESNKSQSTKSLQLLEIDTIKKQNLGV